MSRTALTVALATVAAALALAPAAGAVTYCVPATNPATCTGTSQPSFQAALDAAEAAGADTIEFTNSATYNGAFVYDPPNPGGGTLSIHGQPSAPPTLRSLTDNTTTLNLDPDASDSLTSVRWVTIQAPSGGIGLQTFGNVEDLTVTTAPAAQGSTGIYAVGSSLIDSVIVSMVDNGSPEHRAVSTAESNGIWDGATSIVDSQFTAYEAANIGNEAQIHRNRFVSHGRGILVLCAGGVDIDSVEMVVSGGSGIDARSTTQCGPETPSIVDVRHLSLVGSGPSLQPALATQGNAAGDAHINLRSSIVRGFPTVIEREDNSAPGTTTDITVGHSNIDLTRVEPDSDGGATNVGGNVLNDPHFVEAAGDLRLAWPSSAIDAGVPGPLGAGHSVGDRFQFPRLEDGDGDGAAIRDMGAWEYRGPAVKLVMDQTTAQTGEEILFDASTTTTHPPGSPKTYEWTLDDGFTSTSASISHAFATAGTHTGTVTVTDPPGRSATQPFSVVITAPPGPPPPPKPKPKPPAPPPAPPAPPAAAVAPSLGPALAAPVTTVADGTAPTLTARVQRGRRTRRVRRPGRVLVVTLSERASISALLERCRGGARCTRRRRVTTLTRSGGPGAVRVPLSRTLAAGLYRLTVTARDGAGNRSRPRTLLFTIARTG